MCHKLKYIAVNQINSTLKTPPISIYCLSFSRQTVAHSACFIQILWHINSPRILNLQCVFINFWIIDSICLSCLQPDKKLRSQLLKYWGTEPLMVWQRTVILRLSCIPAYINVYFPHQVIVFQACLQCIVLASKNTMQDRSVPNINTYISMIHFDYIYLSTVLLPSFVSR